MESEQSENTSREGVVSDLAANLQRLATHSRDLMCTAGYDGFFRYVNPAFTRCLGWSEEELLTRPITDFLHPDDRDRTMEALDIQSRGEAVTEFENRYLTKDGGTRILVWQSVGVNDEEVVGMGRDVTEERAQAEELRRSQIALRQSQKMEALGQLAGGVAHDFNNVLSAIVAYTTFAMEDLAEGSTTVHEDLGHVLSVSEHARSLTRRLLMFSRKSQESEARCVVDVVVDRFRPMVTRLFGDTVELSWQLDSGPGSVPVDETELEQVLLNLLNNARDAVGEGGRIEVRTAREEGEQSWVRLEVADNGRGVEADVAEHLFEPFYTTKERGHGTGLGLATCFGIVTQAGGTIDVNSCLGEGTTMIVRLPLGRDMKQAAAASERFETAGSRVLVLEAEPSIRSVTRRVLERAGYDVEAVESLDDLDGEVRSFGLTVVGTLRPMMSVAELRVLLGELPLLRLEGRGFTGDDGFDARITSPFSPTDLLEQVRKILED